MGKKDIKEPETAAPIVEVFSPPVVEVKTAEEWAALKGFTPALNGTRENPSFWKWRAASVRWPVGKELTEADFDAAIAEASNVEIKS